MKRRVIACLFLVAGYLLQLRYPATRDALVARNDLQPYVALLAPPPSCVESSLHLFLVLIAYVAAGIVLFETAKLLLTSWLPRLLIALAQIVLLPDCMRAYASDWWLYVTGDRHVVPRWPIVAAIVTVSAIVAIFRAGATRSREI